MAKKNQNKKKPDETPDESNQGIGALMKTGSTQRERNLEVKRQLIKDGEHPESEPRSSPKTQRERNLELKAQLKAEADGSSKGKGKTKDDSSK